MKDDSEILNFLNRFHIFYKNDVILKYKSYFKTGGSVQLIIEPDSERKLIDLICFLNSNELEFKIVGGTTNIMFFDELEYGILISTIRMNEVVFDNGVFVIGSGYATTDLVRIALINGYGGIEGLEGIPGTVGGALYMNAGAYGYSISDYLLSVRCIDNTGKVFSLNKADCSFEYRKSIFREKEIIIISAEFLFPRIEIKESVEKIEIFHTARHKYQEFSFPTLGSLFSINKDIYLEIYRDNRFYYYLCLLCKLIFKNPLVKRFSKIPNVKPFNFILYKSGFMNKSMNPVSVKGINTIVNSYGYNDYDRLEYIQNLRLMISRDFPIENELLAFPLKKNSLKNQEFMSNTLKYKDIIEFGRSEL